MEPLVFLYFTILILFIAYLGKCLLVSEIFHGVTGVTGMVGGRERSQSRKLKKMPKWGKSVSLPVGADTKVKDLTVHPRTRSEQAVITILEKITQAKFPTVNPDWLAFQNISNKPMELDGYNEQLGIALEFSGPLHTRWTPNKESYNEYFTRICKDAAKIILCERAKVDLIVIDMTLPTRHYHNYLVSRLHDIAKQRVLNISLPEQFTYLPEETAKPYRNEELERTLGLKCSYLE